MDDRGPPIEVRKSAQDAKGREDDIEFLVQRVGQGKCVGPDKPRVGTDFIVLGAGEVYRDVGEVNAGGLYANVKKIAETWALTLPRS